jgi:pimeloyl-ACP methyl ester carboxylesterase
MTRLVFVHGAWHGPWAWDTVVPLLHDAGAETLCPDLDVQAGGGLHDHAAVVVDALDQVGRDEAVVLVGHSYGGLVVREAADQRPDAVDHVVLVDGWAGGDGASLLGLAPPSFEQAIRASAEKYGGGRMIPPPPIAAFLGDSSETNEGAWLRERMVPQSVRSFDEPTRLTGAVDRIPGTAVYCTPQTYAFEQFGNDVGYRTTALDGPHDVMLTSPDAVARILLDVALVREQDA